jgi:hypothetical protein
MSTINKLTYDEKSNAEPITDRTTQATAEDFNDIKTTVNEVVDGVNYIKCNEQILVPGPNVVSFLSPYELGVLFVIIVSKCIDDNGYIVGNTITNKLNTGFTITVDRQCTLVYLSCPQR